MAVGADVGGIVSVSAESARSGGRWNIVVVQLSLL